MSDHLQQTPDVIILQGANEISASASSSTNKAKPEVLQDMTDDRTFRRPLMALAGQTYLMMAAKDITPEDLSKQLDIPLELLREVLTGLPINLAMHQLYAIAQALGLKPFVQFQGTSGAR